jgi:hypothetical protein
VSGQPWIPLSAITPASDGNYYIRYETTYTSTWVDASLVGQDEGYPAHYYNGYIITPGDGPCVIQSGSVYSETLDRADDDNYYLSTDARYILDVWFDNVQQIPSVDYTFNFTNQINPVQDIDTGTEVRVRYVAA